MPAAPSSPGEVQFSCTLPGALPVEAVRSAMAAGAVSSVKPNVEPYTPKEADLAGEELSTA